VIFTLPLLDGDATRLLLKIGDAEEFYEGPTVGPSPKVWTRDQKWKK